MSIAEIAQRAGVSPSTVSLVINGKPSVSASTAESVRQVIREMGYVPPPPEKRQGRRIVRETKTRVAVLATMPDHWLSSPVYGEVLHGLEHKARDHGASMVLHRATEEAGGTFTQPGVEGWQEDMAGLILFGGHPTPAWLGKLAALPCVRVMGGPDEDAWCDHVTYKNAAIGHLAARRLLHQGHSQAACLFLDSHGVMGERARVFTAAMQAGGASVLQLDGTGIVVPCEHGQTMDREHLGRLMQQLLLATPRPTGLFVTADMAAPPVYLQLLQNGVQPGKEMEIVSCNNESSLLNGLEPRPAVVDIHAREVGQRAMERLLWRIDNPRASAADILIHPTLVVPGPSGGA